MVTKENRIDVNGVKIYPFTSEEEVINYLDFNKKILVAVNSKKIKCADDEIRTIVNNNVGYVDGAGAQLALKFKGIKNPVKIPGCELWLKIITAFKDKKSFYLVGGKESVINRTIEKLKKDFSGINIVGYRNGYIKNDAERNSLIKDIEEKKPDVVFIAMGSPKQEYLMQDMYKKHPAVYQGLGGSFDVYVGDVRRAPKWWSEHNLEGVYRAFWEPKKRLKGVLTDVLFVINLLLKRY